jgi:DNA-binding response OmpR family regulator
VSATERKTVVLVEDEDEMRDTLKDVFEDEGFSVVVARNGAEALRVLADPSTKPNVVVLDLMLPIVDGTTVYREMRANPKLADVPVIISTTDPQRAPSGVPVFKKPINLDLLLGAIRRCA